MSGAECPEEYMGCTKCCSERATQCRKVNKPLPAVFPLFQYKIRAPDIFGHTSFSFGFHNTKKISFQD